MKVPTGCIAVLTTMKLQLVCAMYNETE